MLAAQSCVSSPVSSIRTRIYNARFSGQACATQLHKLVTLRSSHQLGKPHVWHQDKHPLRTKSSCRGSTRGGNVASLPCDATQALDLRMRSLQRLFQLLPFALQASYLQLQLGHLLLRLVKLRL